jgi:hypothetical protein
MVVFIVSVLPYLTVKLLFNINKTWFQPPFQPWARRAIVGSFFLMHISSSVNPVLYVLQGFRPRQLGVAERSHQYQEGKSVGSTAKDRRLTLCVNKSSVSSMMNTPEGAGSRDKLFRGKRELMLVVLD